MVLQVAETKSQVELEKPIPFKESIYNFIKSPGTCLSPSGNSFACLYFLTYVDNSRPHSSRARILELDLCLMDALRRPTNHQLLVLQLDPLDLGECTLFSNHILPPVARDCIHGLLCSLASGWI
nr:uncharacterized protein LOC109025772 isoform X2 [Gorilla gorilla gorilla]